MKHFEDNFTGRGGVCLYYQGWLPETSPRAVLVVVHGLADHSSRYRNLVNYFIPRNFAVYALDLRGHGKSGGRRCYVNRFDEYVSDLEIFMDKMRAHYADKPIYIVAHSMGAPVAIPYAMAHQDQINGLITSGANLASNAASPVLMALAGFLSAVVPGMGVTLIDAGLISRDPDVVKAYVNDPLVYRGKISARTGAELVHMWKTLPSKYSALKLPLLILQGTADRLSDPPGSRALYEKAGSIDKTIKLYEGFYHEIFNEKEHEIVMRDMEGWLNARL
jgi:acylglycerol lipase